jgi:hypothetical protein
MGGRWNTAYTSSKSHTLQRSASNIISLPDPLLFCEGHDHDSLETGFPTILATTRSLDIIVCLAGTIVQIALFDLSRSFLGLRLDGVIRTARSV